MKKHQHHNKATNIKATLIRIEMNKNPPLNKSLYKLLNKDTKKYNKILKSKILMIALKITLTPAFLKITQIHKTNSKLSPIKAKKKELIRNSYLTLLKKDKKFSSMTRHKLLKIITIMKTPLSLLYI